MFRVSVRISGRFSFSDRVGIKLPAVQYVELYVGFPTCRHRLIFSRPCLSNT